MSRKQKYPVWLVLYTFLLIYFPPILSFNTLHIVGFISWIGIVSNLKYFRRHFELDYFRTLYYLLGASALYLVMISFYNGSTFLNTARILFWSIDVVPASIFIAITTHKKNYSDLDFIKLLIIVGTIQAILAVVAFVVPEFQSLFVRKMVQFGYRDIFYRLAEHRLFGVASGLTFATPITQVIISMYALYISILSSKKYAFLIPLILFSAVINARISIIILIISYSVLFLVLFRHKLRKSFRILLLSGIGLWIVPTILSLISSRKNITAEWIRSGFSELQSFLRGDNVGYFLYVTESERYILPEGMHKYIGYGDINMSSLNIQSDLGWIHDIWSGGIIYSFILIGIFIFLLRKIYGDRNSRIELRHISSISLIITMVASNFKGIIFSVNELSTLVIILFVSSVQKYRKHI